MSDEPWSVSKIAAARAGSRQLYAEGMHWLVYEFAPSPFDRRSGLSLIFENDGAVRLIRAFPSNWRELADRDLYALSLGT